MRQVFELDLIKLGDFKQTDKNGLVKFLNDYAKQDDWETDREDFIKIKDRFFEYLENYQPENFYIINKEWFDQNDKRLRQEESWIYTYYFLIIWLDKSSKLLTVSDWTYD